MLCSRCSSNLAPVVVFDIDGTLAQYHEPFTTFCDDYFATRLHHGWDGKGNFEDYLGLTRPQYRDAKLAYRQGGNKRWAPLYPGMRAMVMAAKEDLGADIWIATTRPWNRLDNVDPDTQEWIRRFSLPVDGLLYGDDKYRQLIKAVDPERIVAVVEDLGEQVEEANRLRLPVIQIERTHNQAASARRMPRGNIDTVSGWVQHRIDQWKGRNDRSNTVSA